jgi:hypothetical protein
MWRTSLYGRPYSLSHLFSGDTFLARGRYLLVAYALVLSIEGGANVWINFIGKGRTWDLYPLAEAFWEACSVVVVILLARRPSMRQLAAVVTFLMFLDSFVDVCAMGHETWWAGSPVLVEWKWGAHRAQGVLYRYIYAYWAVMWGMQVPLRCFVMAWVLCGGSWKRFALIAAGLNLIWLTSAPDILFYFVWLGLYDAAYPYFAYLPPEGTWNLWNMLLLRVPIGVGAGSLLVWAGRDHSHVIANVPGRNIQ